MITLQQLDDRTLVSSLRSTTCPACGGKKKSRHALCGRDYFKLPHHMRRATYNLLGEGYAEAVHEALNFLGAEKFHTDSPQEGKDARPASTTS